MDFTLQIYRVSSNTKNKFVIFSTNNKKRWSKHELNSSARLRV